MLPMRKYYLDSIFDDFMGERNNLDVMKCDIYEKDGAYHIEADIPGFKKEDINIEFHKGDLKIVLAHKENHKDDKKYVRKERTSITRCYISCYYNLCVSTTICHQNDVSIFCVSCSCSSCICGSSISISSASVRSDSDYIISTIIGMSNSYCEWKNTN